VAENGSIIADTGATNWILNNSSGATISTGQYEERVYRSSNAFCVTCLDFVFWISNNATSIDALSRAASSIFDSFLTDVGIATNLGNPPGFVGVPNAPDTADRSANGNVVGFNWAINDRLNPGQFSPWLIIQTNASFFTNGNLSIIDGGTADVRAFAPTAVPGPIVGAGFPGLIMACGGLIALARRRRKAIAV